MKRCFALILSLCLLFACAKADTVADWFTGSCGDVSYTLTGVPVYAHDVDNEGYWTDSSQLICSCMYDGAEFMMRTADVSAAIERLKQERPDAEGRDIRLQAAMDYAQFFVVNMYDASVTLLDCSVNPDGVLYAAFGYTFPDDANVYEGRLYMIDSRVTVLMGMTCEHNRAALDRLHLMTEAEKTADNSCTLDVAGLSMTLSQPPVRLGRDVYAALEPDFTLVVVQHYTLSMPLDVSTYVGNKAESTLTGNVLPMIQGNKVYNLQVTDEADGSHRLACKTYCSMMTGEDDAEEFGQRFHAMIIMRGQEIWYVLASDTEPGEAVINSMVLAPEAN